MKRNWIKLWKNDYDYRTILTAFGSWIITLIFAIYNGVLGLRHSSLWHGTICIYYLLLVILRGMIIYSERKIFFYAGKEKARNIVCIVGAGLLLILNASLIVPVTIMVKQQRPVTLTLIPAIAMAAYTVYKFTMASVNLKRSKGAADSLVRFLRTINYIDALVSILTLQNTLIMVNAKDSSLNMLPVTAASSGLILFAAVLLSAECMVRGIIGLRRKE
ncbi:MAG: hypothetical protein IKP19_01465 [Oscillospiraceae bacterium]|nr:hypothetical protein [Oscillospiraceae bacterium]